MRWTRFVLSLLVLLALSGTSLAALAQEDLTNTYTFGDGTTVDYPEGWEAETDDNGFLRIVSDKTDTIFFWYFPEKLAELGIDENDMVGVLNQAFVPRDESIQFDPASVETIEVNGVELTGFIYEENNEGDKYERMLVANKLATGAVVVVGAVPLADYKLEEAGTVLHIAASLDASNATASEDDESSTSSLASAAKRTEFPNSYTFDNGYTISFPDGWEMVEDDNGYVSLESEATDIIFSWYSAAELTEYDLSADDLEVILERGFSPQDETLEFSYNDVSPIRIGPYEAYIHEYEDNADGDAYERVRLALGLPDDGVVVIGAIPFVTYELAERDIVLEIAGTLKPPKGTKPDDEEEGETPSSFGDLGGDTGDTGEEESTLGGLGDALTSTGTVDVDLGQSYTFDSGAGFNYPETWEIEVSDSGLVSLSGDNTKMQMADSGLLEGFGFTNVTDPAALMGAIFGPADESLTFDPNEIQMQQINGREIYTYEYEDLNSSGNAFDNIFLTVRFSDGTLGFMHAIPASGPDLETFDTVLTIAASFDLGAGEGGEGGTEGTNIFGEDDVTCMLEAPRVTNVREEPTTSSDIARKLDAGSMVDAYAGALGEDNYVWFQLGDGNWVRQDTVNFDREECGKLPLIEP